jgi:hypothetical protein
MYHAMLWSIDRMTACDVIHSVERLLEARLSSVCLSTSADRRWLQILSACPEKQVQAPKQLGKWKLHSVDESMRF